MTGYAAAAMLSLSLDDLDGDGRPWRRRDGRARSRSTASGAPTAHRLVSVQHSRVEEEDEESYVSQSWT